MSHFLISFFKYGDGAGNNLWLVSKPWSYLLHLFSLKMESYKANYRRKVILFSMLKENGKLCVPRSPQF